ncbi:PAS domain S-box-containing protein [Algoriphagus ratkowskyi]|uniref:histidine kinase n=1 Tax=Algoriphagus ratkowskyi TaxID=57028 RepID=A0A2W7RRJ5_9BACT|nr:PAS domain S-box protein [Algoriphagus ratkowskyi]PZX61140.1 PAS domain S-box-containing protein [Algoriphagus ratkowskyi]TXD79268.1 PAS domain S-box protein [Algoriphagus ratkowskyi]
MEQTQLPHLLLDQSRDLFWIINLDFQLIYANKKYLSIVKTVRGTEHKLYESIFIEDFGEEVIEKWKTYYKRAFKGEYFEIEDHHFNPKANEIQYGQTTFEPVSGEDSKIFAVACRSKDITRIVKQRSEANQLIDSSLDVFCTINKHGNFVYVSAASTNHWGYAPAELVGKPYMNFVLEEDFPKTIEISASILSGQDIRSFVNRYIKKNGDIAYNIWSVRWDPATQLMYCVARDGKEKIEQDEKILQSEQRFKALVQEGYDLFAIINLEGYYIYMSPSSTGIIGIPPEEFIGKYAFEFIHPDDAERTLASLKKVASERRVSVPMYRAKNQKNEWRWVETVLSNMIDNPTINGIVVNSRDITEKVEHEEKVLLSEQRFRALVQDGSDLIGILDAEGRYTYVSPTSIAVLGIAPEEFIGKSAFEFIHPDDVERTAEGLQKIAIESRISLKPFRFLNKKKEWRWVETVVTNMLDNPVVRGIVANSRDITDKIEEEQKLKLLESVITNTNDAVLITEAEPFDEPGPKIIYINEAFTKMTGYTANEVLGKTPRILQGPNSNREELAKLGRKMRNWEPCELTTINYKKSGEEFWINFSLTPVADENGWYTHWISIERDVTEKKTKELEKDLINEISKIFNQSIDNDLTKCLTKLCAHITKFGDFDFAEIWLPAIDAKTINRVTNYAEGKAGNTFYEATKEIKTCAIGEGMPGYVWEYQTTEIWGNFEGQWLTSRKVAAMNAGIVAMMGVPLKDKEEVIGVLLLGTQKTKSALVHYSALLQKLESSIGAELSRKKIEIELAQIFDFIPGIICVAGFDGYLKRINPAGLELLGYSLEEMCSQPIRSFVHEDDRLKTKDQQFNLYSGGRQSNYENRYITKQGKIVWLSWSATSAPEHGIIYAVAKDITEEKKLRELNRQANQLAKIGSWDIDLVNQSLFWSDEVHKMHETDPKLFIPKLETGINFFREDFRELVQQNIENSISFGTPFDYEAILITKNKTELWVRATGNSEFIEGECKRIFGSFQDIDERKKSEIKLAESENKFRTILEAEPECVKLLDSDGKLLMMNQAGLAMLEAESEEQVLGKAVINILLPDHRKAFADLIKNVFRGEAGKLIYEIEGLQGTHRWLETHSVPMKNEQGLITSLLGITRDITERKEAEEKRSSLQATIENSLNEIYIFDADTLQFIYVNKGALNNLGYSEEEIKEISPLDIKPDFTSTSFKELINPLVTDDQKKIIFFTNHQRKDGSTYPVEVHLQFIIEGYNKRFLAIILDITERKKAELSILQAHERFEKVTEATKDSIWDWDLVNHTFYRSSSIERFFGKEASASLKESEFWKDKFHLEDLPKIQASLDDAISDPLCSRWELEYRVYNEKGEILYVIDRGIIVRDIEGKAVRMVGAMANVTEQKVMQIQLNDLNQELQKYTQELERSNEELEQFAFVASHDLQEPLRMIASFMDLLKRKYGDQLDEKGHQYIHFATDGAKRMKQIILDLLEYSRASKPTEGTEELNLNQVIADFKQLRRKLISEKSASFTLQELPTLKTYKAVVTQIFHCLLDNALKYSDNPVQIEIEGVEYEHEWKFSIKDNGVGIDPQFHDKIFVMFQRLQNKDEFAGTGIGLSIAKRHVAFLGGKIWLESILGEGTVFYFTISKIK